MSGQDAEFQLERNIPRYHLNWCPELRNNEKEPLDNAKLRNCVKTQDFPQLAVISSPTLISQLISTCFYLKYFVNPLSKTCMLVVSTSPLLLFPLQFPLFAGRTAWLELLVWDIVTGSTVSLSTLTRN